MKNKLILMTVMLIIMVSIASINVKTYAVTALTNRAVTRAESVSAPAKAFSVELKTMNSTVNPGDTIRVQMHISSMSNIEHGLIAMLGQFEYDSNVLEISEFQGEEGWNFNDESYNSDNLKFITDASNYVKAGDIITIILKVKDNAPLGATTFKVHNLKASDGDSTISANDATLSLTVEQKHVTPDDFRISSDLYEILDGHIAYVLPNTSVAEFKSHITSNRTLHVLENGAEQAESSIIKTGMSVTVENEDARYDIIVIGDIDRDGKADIVDLAKMKLHLIDKNILSGIDYRAGDVDRDRHITINDLAVLKLYIIGLKTF